MLLMNGTQSLPAPHPNCVLTLKMAHKRGMISSQLISKCSQEYIERVSKWSGDPRECHLDMTSDYLERHLIEARTSLNYT